MSYNDDLEQTTVTAIDITDTAKGREYKKNNALMKERGDILSELRNIYGLLSEEYMWDSFMDVNIDCDGEDDQILWYPDDRYPSEYKIYLHNDKLCALGISHGEDI